MNEIPRWVCPLCKRAMDEYMQEHKTLRGNPCNGRPQRTMVVVLKPKPKELNGNR